MNFKNGVHNAFFKKHVLLPKLIKWPRAAHIYLEGRMLATPYLCILSFNPLKTIV